MIDHRFGSTEPAPQTAIDACAAVALRGGTFEHRGAGRTDAGTERSPDDARFARRPGPFTAEHAGFNVQAAVRIAADEDAARERLLRYCARPAFAHERLELLADGCVTYRLKVPTRRATHRIMTPVELLARLAALVPPPRYPLARYHGVLAPHSKRRAAVVPRRPSLSVTPTCPPGVPARALPVSSAPAPAESDPRPAPKLPSPQQQALSSLGPSSAFAASPAPRAIAPPGPAPAPRNVPVDVDVLGVNPITVRPATRLLDGLLTATSPRLDWAPAPTHLRRRRPRQSCVPRPPPAARRHHRPGRDPAHPPPPRHRARRCTGKPAPTGARSPPRANPGELSP